jgi:hypothetical protein
MSATKPARRKMARHVSELIDPSETLYRLTVDEYERIGEVLNDPKVELIEGLMVASLAKDRRRARVYGGTAGIPVYWIVNLNDRQVEVHTGPVARGYKSRVIYVLGSHVPVVLNGTTVGQIAVDDLLF